MVECRHARRWIPEARSAWLVWLTLVLLKLLMGVDGSFVEANG